MCGNFEYFVAYDDDYDVDYDVDDDSDDSQTFSSWTLSFRTLSSRTSRSPDTQVPGHSAPRTSRSFGHPGLSDTQVPGHSAPRTSRSFGHPGLLDIQLFWTSSSFGHPALLDIQVFWTSRSFGLPVLILNCQNAGHVMLPNHSVRSYPKSIETLIIGGTKNMKAQRLPGTGITFLESIILDLKKEYHPYVKFLPKNISHDRELVKPI